MRHILRRENKKGGGRRERARNDESGWRSLGRVDEQGRSTKVDRGKI